MRSSGIWLRHAPALLARPTRPNLLLVADERDVLNWQPRAQWLWCSEFCGSSSKLSIRPVGLRNPIALFLLRCLRWHVGRMCPQARIMCLHVRMHGDLEVAANVCMHLLHASSGNERDRTVSTPSLYLPSLMVLLPVVSVSTPLQVSSAPVFSSGMHWARQHRLAIFSCIVA